MSSSRRQAQDRWRAGADAPNRQMGGSGFEQLLAEVPGIFKAVKNREHVEGLAENK